MLAVLLIVIANTAFELGMVFYNAMLPAIAPPERIGRISGYGWGLGYIGGLVCLVIALKALVQGEPAFGISTEARFNFRATNLLVALWMLTFSLPLLFMAPRTQATNEAAGIGDTFRRLGQTVKNIREYREIAKLLVARLIYNDGLVTVFAFGGIYAAGTFGMELSEVITFGIAINVAAGLGAWAFGFIDDRFRGANHHFHHPLCPDFFLRPWPPSPPIELGCGSRPLALAFLLAQTKRQVVHS